MFLHENGHWLNNYEILFSFFTGISGTPETKIPGGHPILDVPRSDQSASLWPRSGHLVPGHNGDRNGGRRTAVLQRTAPAGHAQDKGDAAAEIQEQPQGVAASAELPRQDAGEGSGAEGDGHRAVGAPVSETGRPSGSSRAVNEGGETRLLKWSQVCTYVVMEGSIYLFRVSVIEGVIFLS